MKYSAMARYYDLFYKNKKYNVEVEFLKEVIKNKKTILDAGCGTGNHIKLLEEEGYVCDGLDASQEMVDITKSKIKGNVYLGNIINFSINRKYDVIISMFAVINHLKNTVELTSTLLNMRNHLNPDGIIIIDLHNPQSSGKKTDFAGNNKRIMKWDVDFDKKSEHTTVIYELEDGQIMKNEYDFIIISIEQIREVCSHIGLQFVSAFSNYEFNPANEQSKNIQIVLRRYENDQKV